MDGNEIRQLVVDDGIFTNGLRITSFTVWPVDWVNQDSATGMLSLRDTITPGGTFPANDPSVFAWAYFGRGASSTPPMLEQAFPWQRIDPDHIINEELFLHNTGNFGLNYLITAEPYMMTPEQGVMQLVKAANQA